MPRLNSRTSLSTGIMTGKVSRLNTTGIHKTVGTLGQVLEYLEVSTLFTTDEWSSDIDKQVTISSGATVRSRNTNPALVAWSNNPMGGTLTIINNGDILGGSDLQSPGGNAMDISIPNVTVINNGNIWGGGGAGGWGGRGGHGAGSEILVPVANSYQVCGYCTSVQDPMWCGFGYLPWTTCTNYTYYTNYYYGTEGGLGTEGGVGAGDIKEAVPQTAVGPGALAGAVANPYAGQGGAGGTGGAGGDWGQPGSPGMAGEDGSDPVEGTAWWDTAFQSPQDQFGQPGTPGQPGGKAINTNAENITVVDNGDIRGIIG